MSSRIAPRVRRLAMVPGLALALLLPACSGGSDVTGPDPEPLPPAPVPTPLPGPQNPDPQVPGPTQPIVAGSYVLVRINDSQPGQLVTIANPDGIVIGLYRFDASTSLVLDPLQSWALELSYSDDKSAYGLSDAGNFTWTGDPDGVVLHFDSEVYGDEFVGKARDGLAAIRYDFDGDGQTETTFVFQRTGD